MSIYEVLNPDSAARNSNDAHITSEISQGDIELSGAAVGTGKRGRESELEIEDEMHPAQLYRLT